MKTSNQLNVHCSMLYTFDRNSYIRIILDDGLQKDSIIFIFFIHTINHPLKNEQIINI